tara:strand:- start:704 stop:1081 length:378 start_codon:yes stop_codon:yes gene_type:complete
MPRKSNKNVKLVEDNNDSNQTEEVTNNVDDSLNRGEIIDIEWEQVQPIFEFKARLEDLEAYFANMCLQFEKEKINLMTQITYGQNDLYSMAQELQKSKNIDESLTYELKLPTESGQKGFFVRKDD